MRRVGLLACALVACGDASVHSVADAPRETPDAPTGGGVPDGGPTGGGVPDAPIGGGVPDAPIGGGVPDAPTGGSDAGVVAIWYTGVNLAGAEFGDQNLPGTYGTDYIYPNAGEVDYFVGKGLTIFRIAFRWERLQRALNADLDATEAGRLDAIVGYATAAGARVILDPHNYARYHGSLVGSAQVPYSAFADFWGRLAARYGPNRASSSAW